MGTGSTAGSGRSRRGRRLRSRLAAAAAGAVAGALLMVVAGGPPPVGHFTSARGKDRFLAAYEAAMRDLPAPQRTQDLRTSHGVVRVHRFAGAGGDRAPLLLLPGRAAPTPVWADNLPHLLRHRSVYTVDLLGEPGRSVQDRPFTHAEDQAVWLHEVLAQLPEDRVHVVGMSIGGWTAMNLAIHRPAGIASLTLIEPVLVFSDLTLEAVVRSIPASLPWAPKALRDGFASWTAGGAPVEDEPVADLIETGMATYHLQVPTPSRLDEARIADVAIPTLVILAEESPLHDARAAAEAARRGLRDGTVRLYPGASHAVNGEHPAEIAADIAEHLRRAG